MDKPTNTCSPPTFMVYRLSIKATQIGYTLKAKIKNMEGKSANAMPFDAFIIRLLLWN